MKSDGASVKSSGAVAVAASVSDSTQPPKEKKTWTRVLTFFQLLVYANPTWHDYILLVVGTIAAMGAGVPFPIMGIVFGQLLDDMNDSTCDELTQSQLKRRADSTDSFQDDVNEKVLILVYLAIAALVLIYTYIFSWNLLSQRLAQRLREKYFVSLLGQDAAFFDTRKAGEVSARLNNDIQLVQSGTSEKVGMLIANVSFLVAAYVVAFTRDAELAGMLLSLIPAFLLMAFLGGFFIQKYSAALSTAIASASSVASEALTHVSVVQAFGAGPRLEGKFAGYMHAAHKFGIRKATATATQAGSLYFIAFSANALAFWQGSIKIANAVEGKSGGATIGEIYTVVFLIVDSCVMLSQVAPFLSIFSAASAAFEKLRDDINHKPSIDGTGATGLLPQNSEGAIEFQNVEFAYPSRPDQPALTNVSFSIPAGKHTAVVGPSGGGKSTIVSLILRLYDPTSGQILLDGQALKEVNVKYLRSLIGMVQQEPTLLNRSLMENIALGLVNSANPKHAELQSALMSSDLQKLAAEVKDGKDMVEASAGYSPAVQAIVKLIAEAADLADATSFIQRLQYGFGTPVGTGGSQLSGGQRQRVALARALIRDPKILILDEATASLDSATEQRIQSNLEKIAKGRAVLSVAHRLSTIKDADNIMVFKAGGIVEQGTHDELLALNGDYADLVKLQSLKGGDAEDGASSSSVRDEVSIELAKGGRPGSIGSDKETRVSATAGDSDTSSQAAEVDSLTLPMGGGTVLRKLGHFVRPNVIFLITGAIAAVIVGCTYSASGVIFGSTVGEINACSDPDAIRDLGKLFSGMFFLLAVVEFFANFWSWTSFGFISEKLLYRLRVLSFRSLFKQGMGFHQAEGRSPATLLSIITKDTAELGGFSGSVMGTLIAVTVNLLVAIILSHVLAWKIAIVCLVLIPIQFGAGILQIMELARYQRRHTEAFSQAVGITVEAVNSIKTISTLSLESEVFQTYRRTLRGPRREMVGASAYVNIWLAVAYSVGNLIYAFAYWWGAKLIIKGEYNPTQFFIILIAMLVGAQLWGQMFALAPEVTRARLAASRIMNLVDLGNDENTKPPLPDLEPRTEKDLEAVAGTTALAASPRAHGGTRISFKNVTFSYPARPELTILRDVSFELEPGKFYGLVGPSGAGKSTIMSLVQGMYNATEGAVELDGVDMSRAEGAAFRDEIAIVPQDSALFDGTVRFNVGLGARPGHDATQEEIEEACRVANMHDVIMALPEGYDTECGPNGSRLSGGQRQRLAIARALVRKPRLLLLDESTSALDAENEKALQEGLERAARGITVLAITHRIHTVRRADVILVVDGGQVVDQGSHEELMATSESYRSNATHQQLGA